MKNTNITLLQGYRHNLISKLVGLQTEFYSAHLELSLAFEASMVEASADLYTHHDPSRADFWTAVLAPTTWSALSL